MTPMERGNFETKDLCGFEWLDRSKVGPGNTIHPVEMVTNILASHDSGTGSFNDRRYVAVMFLMPMGYTNYFGIIEVFR